MSVASIDHTNDDTPAESLDDNVVDVTAWLDHPANLRRSFTRYEPRHRADGPAL